MLITSDKYPTRKLHSVLPFGYIPGNKLEGGDPYLAYPDLAVLALLDEALDRLDMGDSYKVASDFLNDKLKEHYKDIPDTEQKHDYLSMMGIKRLWDYYRPDHPKKNYTPPKPLLLDDPNVKLSRKEKSLLRKKQELTQNRRKLTIAKTAVKRQEAQLANKKEKLFKRYGKGRAPELQVITLYETGPKVEPTAEKVVANDDDFKPLPVVDDIQERAFFKPNAGPQEAFLAADEREVLYGGAAGGGKSYALLADPMRYFHNPNFNGLIVRRTTEELRELIWKSRELYLQYHPDCKWNDKKSQWTFPAGGHMWMTYLERDEDLNRYQGQAFNYIAFDELTHHPTPFAWNYLRSRLRTIDPELPTFMRATTNPGGPGHGWVKRMFIDPAPPGVPFPARDIDTDEVLVYPESYSDKSMVGKPLFYRKFIPAKLADNPYLTKDGQYEANLLSLPENQRRQLLDGDWNVADGAAFSEFRISKHTCKPFPIPSDWMKFRSCDWGYSERQATAVHWYAVDPSTGTIYVYREMYVNKHTAVQVAEKIRELEAGENVSYGVLDWNAWGTHGNMGPTPAEEMIRRGIRWRKADKGPGSRIASKNRLHELLRVDAVSEKPGIIFFDTCRQIISTLPIIPMAKDTDDIDPKFADDHAYDSIRYGIQSRPNTFHWDITPRYKFNPSDSVFGY